MPSWFIEFEIGNDADYPRDKKHQAGPVRSGVAIGLVETRLMRLYVPRVTVIQLGLKVEKNAFSRRTPHGRELLDRAWDVRLTLLWPHVDVHRGRGASRERHH